MNWTEVILFVIGLAALFEGIFIAFLPDLTRKVLRDFIKRPRKARVFGIIEIIVALIILYWAFRSLA